MKRRNRDISIIFNRIALLICMLVMVNASLTAVTLINENIQNWTASTAYGNYTQSIAAGVVTMTSCMVSPGAAATGTCSVGRIQMQAANGIVELPSLPSVGQVEFHFAAGSSGRSVKLQKLNGSAWEDITTFTGISTTGATYSYDVNFPASAIIRLAQPSHALYVHDIIVTDYQNVELPIVSTIGVSGITYNTAVSGGNVENAGASSITARGVCWSRNPDPVAIDSLTNDGTGIGTYTSIITNLLPDTDYHVRAYAVNASGTSYGEDLLFHTANLGIPSTQTTNFIFYPGTTSVQATWTPGNGAQRIVVVNRINSFTNPVNGTSYAADAVYHGSGEQVVYNGSTQIIEGEAINVVSVTGLTPNTTYWFRAYDYNGEGASTLYNTNAATNNPRSVTTLNSVVEGYYTGISGTGSVLKSALHNLLQTTHLTQFSYNALWTQLQYTDEDSVNTNNIIEEYTGWSVPKTYYGGGTSQWNREHTWSKSHGDFGEVPPAGTDLHHLRPADATVNSAKGNKDFDDGGTPYIDSSPYTGYSGATGCNTDSDSWEPRTAEKGDIARMLFYMAVRYEGDSGVANLEMQDTTPTSGPFYGKLSTLLRWHVQDPPDSWERRRNNRIQERQGNRNPFIDHPEFVNLIWAPFANPATINSPYSFVAHWSHAVNATAYYLDVATDSLFTNFVAGYQNLNVGYVDSYLITVPASNTTYYYRLRSFFTSGYGMYSNVIAVSLNEATVVYASFDTDWNANEEYGYYVTVSWSTLSEYNLAGFNIYRGLCGDLAQAQIVNEQIIPATNTQSLQTYHYTDCFLNSWTWYYYWLQDVGVDSNSNFYGPDSVYVGEVHNSDEVLPASVSLLQSVYPNPFHKRLYIEINLPKELNFTLQVYNRKGQFVRSIYSGLKSAGAYTLYWDGLDQKGCVCAPGLYFIKMQTGGKSYFKKVMLY